MKDKTTTLVRVVLFVVAVGLAIWGFSTALLNLGTKEVGYQTVSALPDADMPYYSLDYQLSFYISAKGLESKAQYNAVQSVYTTALKEAVRLLDARTEYAGVVNIATLNNNQGTAFDVDPWLYQILSDAYSITLSDSNYNMFAGALYGEWSSILILPDPKEFDPEYNEYTAERLSALAKAASPEHFTLVLKDGKVKFVEDSAYKATMAEYEATAPALDLGTLAQAYVMDHVAKALADAGYTAFRLTSSSGLCICADASSRQGFVVYNEDGTSETLASEGRAVFLQARGFRLFDNDLICYNIEGKDGSMLYRSMFYDVATGRQPEWPSVVVLDEDGGSCVSVTLRCLDGGK